MTVTINLNMKMTFHFHQFRGQFLMVILMERIPPRKNPASGVNGDVAPAPSCEVYGPGKFCDGSFCRPCWQALHQDLETPPPKRKAEEKALSDSKKPKVGPSHDRGTDSPVS